MIARFVGVIDWPTASIFISLFIGIGICFFTYRTTHKTKEDYELEKLRQDNENLSKQYQLETYRAIETKKLEQNLITSHRAE